MTDWYQYPISHGYITDYQGPNTDTPHFAFDLAVPQGTQVWFPVSGTIEQADYAVWSGKQGGGEVFIKPDNGWPEEYMYHLDELNVQSGQHVNAGDVVGWSGGQNTGGNHPTDPAWSSGAHLHIGEFDNYVNTPDGQRPYGANPQYILDMANVVNLTGSIDVKNQIIGDETTAISTPVNAVQSISAFFSGPNLTKIGLYALGGLVILGGVLIVGKQ